MMIALALVAAVTVAFPKAGQTLPPVNRVYMIGATTGGETNLVVADRNVPVYRTGAWSTMVKVVAGRNVVKVGDTEVVFNVKAGAKQADTDSVAKTPAARAANSAPATNKYTKLEYASDTPREPPRGLPPSKITVVVDAGHGGEDSGALSPHGYAEKSSNLAVAQYLRDALTNRGYRVVMTRDTDKAVKLYDRPKVAHAHGAAAFISIHHNAPPCDSNPKELRYTAVYAWNNIGAQLAKAINSRMASNFAAEKLKNNGVPHANFAVTRNPEIPSCLVEVDFITSPEGEEACWNPERQRRTAEAIAAGFADWAAAQVSQPSDAVLETDTAIYRLNRQRGSVSKIIRKADRATVVTSVDNLYQVRSVDGDFEALEAGDVVTNAEMSATQVKFVCTNAQLRAMSIIKRYQIVNGGLSRQLTFVNGADVIRFVLPFTESHFTDDFFKDAYYLGAGYIGPLKPAAKVTKPVCEETFVQTSKGMVLFNTAHPERGNFVNMRVRIAGNPVLPWWQSSINSYRESDDRLWYLPDGWRMCIGMLDAPAHGAIEYEDRLNFFSTGLFDFFDRIYGQDPAMKELYATIAPQQCDISDIFVNNGWGAEPYMRYLSQMVDSGLVITKYMLSAKWADYRWRDGFYGSQGGWVYARDVAEFLDGLRSILPRTRLGAYSIVVGGSPGTKLFDEHPEWFRKYNRAGKLQQHFPGVVENYQTMFNRAECREFLAKTAVQHVQDIHGDLVYWDEAQQQNRINWQAQELIRDDHSIDLWRQLRDRAVKANQMLFFNGSGNPFADFNYMECAPRQSNPKYWRDFAGVVLGIEMVSRLRPESRMSLIDYTPNFINAISRCLAVGWVPNSAKIDDARLAHFRAVQEMGKTLPIDARYTPDWKRDPQTTVESFAVNRLGSRDVVLSFINRSEATNAIPVEVDLASIGFAAGERVNVWAHQIWFWSTPREQNVCFLADREIKAAYRETGVNLDKVSDAKLIYSGAAAGKLKYAFDAVIPNGTVQLVITPGNAAIGAVDDLPANNFFTKRHGAEIKDGKVFAKVPCDILFADLDRGLRRAHVEPGVRDLSAIEFSAKPFELVRQRPDHGSAIKFADYPLVPENCRVWPVDVTNLGTRVTLVGRHFKSYRNLRNLQTNLPPAIAEVDATNLTFRVGTTERNDTLDIRAYAGLALKNVRSLRLAFTNSFWNATSVDPPGSHVWGGTGSPTVDFAGFVVDYRAKDGKSWVKRVDYPLGVGASMVKNNYPGWGTGKVQDQVVSLGDLFYKPACTFSLDLAKFAPTNWNGDVFFSVGFSHLLANRRMQVKILSVNDDSATDFIKCREMKQGAATAGEMPQPVALPRLNTPVEKSAVPKWGKVKHMQAYRGDLVEDTSAFVAYDDYGLHFVIVANEHDKPLRVQSDHPNHNDHIELFFPFADGGRLQIVADAEGRAVTYPQDAFPADKLNVKNFLRPGKGWGIRLYIPYAALKIEATKPGLEIKFNLCRSRIARQTELSTWSPIRSDHGGYFDYEKFGVLTFGRLDRGMGRWEEFNP